jgi:hypothetical protein
MSVFARYLPDSQLRHAGRTTIGSTPSKGMTADFKRGSSSHFRSAAGSTLSAHTLMAAAPPIALRGQRSAFNLHRRQRTTRHEGLRGLHSVLERHAPSGDVLR